MLKTYGDKGLRILTYPCNQFGAEEPWEEDKVKEFQAQYNLSD